MKMSQTHQVLIVKQDLATSAQLSHRRIDLYVFRRRCYDGSLSPGTVERTEPPIDGDVMTLNLSLDGGSFTRESES